ncbi:hypothetical protein L1887_17969 [Cichorium endivia]|nr:hypothetical protein L1887_17969 [Cichorium endivia]
MVLTLTPNDKCKCYDVKMGSGDMTGGKYYYHHRKPCHAAFPIRLSAPEYFPLTIGPVVAVNIKINWYLSGERDVGSWEIGEAGFRWTATARWGTKRHALATRH